MLRFVERRDIDTKKWDETVQNSEYASICALSWYLDLACVWKGLVFGDYEFILPISKGKKYLLKYAFMPFNVQSFCIYGREKANNELLKGFFKILKNEFFKVDYSVARELDFKIDGYKVEKRKSQILRLNKSYDDIYSSFSNSHKRNIKKAEKLELVFEKSKLNQNIEKLISTFYVGRNLKMKNYLTQYFSILIELEKRELVDVFCVFDSQKEIQNVSIFRKLAKNRYSLNSINSENGAENGAMFFGLNEFIKQNANSDMIIDFEGSNIESIRRRNIGFGGEDVFYSALHYRKI